MSAVPFSPTHSALMAKGFTSYVASLLENAGVKSSEVAEMSVKELFNAVLEGEGIYGYTSIFLDAIVNIQEVKDAQ